MSLTYHQPETVSEALELLGRLGRDAHPLAGGTDLGVLLRRRRVKPSAVISLARVEEMRRLEARDNEIIIGAGTTHRAIERSPLFADALRALPEACETVGSVQIRNLGTVGGNLCNASPAADTPPVLLAFDASVAIAGAHGVRRVPLEAFFMGYRRTALTEGELLLDVRVPLPPPHSGSAFLKIGRRKAMEISIACAGALVTLDGGTQQVREVRIGLGSVGPVSLRARQAEALLRGHPLDPGRIAAAARTAAAECSPIDDLRATAEYRRLVVETLVSRALTAAAERAACAR